MNTKNIVLTALLAAVILCTGIVSAFAGFAVGQSATPSENPDSFMQDAHPVEDQECVIVDGSSVGLYDSNGEPVNGGSGLVTGKKP